MGNESALKKNLFRLIVLTIAAAAIYGLPYFRYTFWDTFLTVFSLNDNQMANLQSVYGIFALIAYIPGGWLADRLSVKKLILFSLYASAAVGIYLMTIPGYYGVLACHAILGITSILTFWPAFIKTIRSLANDSEQGKAFGIMEGTRGILNIVEATVALAIFGIFLKVSPLEAIEKVILYYVIVLVVLGVIIAFTIKDVKPDEVEHEDHTVTKITKEERRKIIIGELKRPSIWLISGIVFCSYFMNIAFYNFTPYAENVLKVGPVAAGVMVVLAQWVRPFAAVTSGVLGDKISIARMVMIGFVLMIIGTAAVLILPVSAPVIVFMISIAIIYIAMYSLQANHFAMLEEGKIHKEATGTAVGIVSTLGYLPEVIASQVALWILTRFGESNGGTLAGSYNYLFAFLIGVFVVGLILTIVWSKTNAKEKKLADN